MPSANNATSFPFSITQMDPLGQGVCKKDETITFIAKTLPGESGTAHVYKRKKGVQFARVESVETAAQNRVVPECVHFDRCPGCHYLHTDYESERAFKAQTLQRYCASLGVGEGAGKPDIEVIAAPQRLGYRNRIQLHYKGETIGLVDARTNSIIEIPRCQLVREELRPALERLYADKQWSQEHPGEGHCELYWRNGEATLQWNQPYAHGGFSQVFEAMNQQLREVVAQCLQGATYSSLLDLFSGEGNLSDPLVQSQGIRRVMVDASEQINQTDFIMLDLHKVSALGHFFAEYPQHFDAMLVDPPRKGFANLAQWLQRYQPRHLIYVSCHPATLMRDLRNIEQPYEIRRVVLLDMFPGTYHFETVVHVEFTEQG